MGPPHIPVKRNAVEDCLKSGLSTVDEIQGKTRFKRRNIRSRLYTLRDLGRAVLVGDDKWALRAEMQQDASKMLLDATKKEQQSMADEGKHESTTCVGCIRKEFELRDKDRDLANAKAETERFKAEAAQVATATSQVKSLQDEVKNLTEQVQTAGNLPSVKDFITHCESGNCASHAQEWTALKTDMAAQFLAGLTSDIVQAKAQEMDLIPKKITIKGIESLLGGQHGTV